MQAGNSTSKTYKLIKNIFWQYPKMIFFMASFLHYDVIVGDNLFNMISLIFNHPFKARYIIIGVFFGRGMHDNAQSPLNPVVLEKQLKCKKVTDTRLTYHYSAVFLVSKNTLWAFMTQCLLTYISNKDVKYYSHVDLLLKLLTWGNPTWWGST